MKDEELRAWAYLSAVAEPPCAPLIALVDDVGAVAAAAAIKQRAVPSAHRRVLVPTEARAAVDRSAQDLETCERIGARLVTRDDADWPAWQLLALDRADTAARGGAPLALWVRGPRTCAEIADSSLALIGSRAASSYGDYVAGQMAGQLADHGWSVISGGAYGIDGAAHRGALAAGGCTAAVLACGIDRDYPTGHAQLLREIAQEGLVVTEYAPGTAAAKHRFLTRNRLVAALASGVIVVEAGRRSGAANTAAWAKRIGRPLGAVPGPVTSATSVGTNAIIAEGDATLVVDGAAAIALASPDGHDARPESRRRPTDGLRDEQKQVLEALPARGGLTVDEIAFVSGISVDEVLRSLASLELAGFVDGSGGTWQLVRG
ncbi:DNA-processing protein DprA [Gordonia sp. (in: high G+C Gram-positive bacteria)]|uniref:DNA-processing protein DprA n=1 Tax=Gordonia sp. (in: high G+C Gram-positive bacteria) TaxID=84139 RepID=UPI0016ADA2FB|nr:DNA-processing protein DprA [Gordonia sp. (in: high G+C Gram-positive bacteria)]NLG45625.1 DNA-protecting protein DprA [Gordonia sp. (in: high G+C Gram-positive bacteria)]